MYGKRKKGLAGALSVACAVGFLTGNLIGMNNIAYAAQPGYAEADYELTIDDIRDNIVKVDDEPFVDFTGQINDEDKEYDFVYTAERSGKYRVDILDVKANCQVILYVNDSLGNSVKFWTSNSSGFTLDFEEDETYSLTVSEFEGKTNFTVRIRPQKETIDITDITELEDQFSFASQENRYTYTAPYDGYYRFGVTNKTANMTCNLLMWDQYGTYIINNYISNSEGSEGIELQGGETYTIQVKQSEGIGQYALHVMQQNPLVDISGYTKINDRIKFGGQRNYYDFTAPVTGEYLISKTEKDSDVTLGIALYDNNNAVFDYSTNSYSWAADEKQSVALEEGKTYRLLITEINCGKSDFEIEISYPVEAQSFLDSFAHESRNQESESNSGDSETGANAQTEDPRIEELREQNETLESELAQMEMKYEMVVEVLNDLGVNVEQETE